MHKHGLANLFTFETCSISLCFLFFLWQSGKIRRSRMKFQYVIVSVIPDGITGRWLAAPPASCRGGEGRERISGALYVRLCASPGSGENAQARREALATTTRAETWTLRTAYYCSSRSRSRRTPYTLFQPQRGKKFGEMQSVYQHLISLLFVFSSLQVNQLTEGCSCALTHPQDAFCNSDIGK